MRLYPSIQIILTLKIEYKLGSVKIQFVLKNIWSGGISKGDVLSHYFMANGWMDDIDNTVDR